LRKKGREKAGRKRGRHGGGGWRKGKKTCRAGKRVFILII
jgi:hypothetical protein